MACHLCSSSSPGPWAARLCGEPTGKPPNGSLAPPPLRCPPDGTGAHAAWGPGGMSRCWWQTGAQCRQRPLEGFSRQTPTCHQNSAPTCKRSGDRPCPEGVAHLTMGAIRLLRQGLRPHAPTPDLCRPLAAEWPSAHPESFANVSLYSCDKGASFTHFLMTRHLTPNLGRC